MISDEIRYALEAQLGTIDVPPPTRTAAELRAIAERTWRYRLWYRPFGWVYRLRRRVFGS